MNCTLCIDDVRKERHSGKDEVIAFMESYAMKESDPFPLSAILEKFGVAEAIWWLRVARDVDHQARLFAEWCAQEAKRINPSSWHTKTAEGFLNAREAWAAAWFTAFYAALAINDASYAKTARAYQEIKFWEMFCNPTEEESKCTA